MTNVEMQCLFNFAMCVGKSRDNKVFDVLLELCRQLEADEGILEHIGVWELIMTNAANIYGDMGEYDQSDAIGIRTMKEEIHCYRMNLLDMNLYIILWNNDERKKKNIPVKQGYKEDVHIKRCISLCQINRNTKRAIKLKKRQTKLKSD